jgi:hypothetical protein
MFISNTGGYIKMKTEKIVEKLGNVFFVLVVVGIPCGVLELIFKGTDGTDFWNWLLSQAYYRIGGVFVLLGGGVFLYLLFMYMVKMWFEMGWFWMLKRYQKLKGWKERNKNDETGDKNNDNDLEAGKRRSRGFGRDSPDSRGTE